MPSLAPDFGIQPIQPRSSVKRRVSPLLTRGLAESISKELITLSLLAVPSSSFPDSKIVMLMISLSPFSAFFQGSVRMTVVGWLSCTSGSSPTFTKS